MLRLASDASLSTAPALKLEAAESFLENIILTQLTPLGMIFPVKFSYLEQLGKL